MRRHSHVGGSAADSDGPARYSLLWPKYAPFAASFETMAVLPADDEGVRAGVHTERRHVGETKAVLPAVGEGVGEGVRAGVRADADADATFDVDAERRHVVGTMAVGHAFDVDIERLRRAREYEDAYVSGPRESVAIFRAKGIRTLGLYAKTYIAKGSIIGYYLGESLSRKAYRRRYRRRDAEFVLQVDEVYIDAGNALLSTKMRYINCPSGLPGVSANVYFYEEVVKSRRDIAAGEELFIDYGKSFHV